MSVLYIAELTTYQTLNMLPATAVPPVTEQTLTISATASQSAAFNVKTGMIRLHTDAICSVAFGTNPTATATNARLAANQTEYFVVAPGSKVSVITNT